MAQPLVGIVMGSDSDWEVMQQAAKQLTEFGVAFEAKALSAHRTPAELEAWVGKLERGGRSLHRFRVGDYRVYFERHELGVLVHRILSRNTLKDFLYRSGLKVEEDEALQQNPKFWEMIEAARGPK